MVNKSTKFSLDSQGIGEATKLNFLRNAYDSVNAGIAKSKKDFENDPEQFGFRNMKSMWLSSSIKKIFKSKFLTDFQLRNSVRHLKSFGVDYFILEGKVIVCFKKMDVKSRISGFYSKRFKEILAGGKVRYSKKMLEILGNLGIQKALPIYYIGHVLDSHGRAVDTRIVHYNENGIAYQESLKSLFLPSLFDPSKKEDQLVVKMRNKRRDVS